MKSRILAVVFCCLTMAMCANAAPATGRYKAIVDSLQVLQTQYAGISSIYSIGANDDGVDILAMRVSIHPTQMDPQKIGQLVVGTHHGNELKAADFTMAFLTNLLQRYSSSELYRGNLADMEWTVVPVLNISGYNANDRYEHGQDPNRDYPGPCISAKGGKLKSISLMMDVLARRQYVGSLTVHGYAGALTYPWGVDVSDTHSNDQNQFETVTAKAAALAGYRHGTSTDVVYPCDGAFEDYTYWKHGMWSLLLELRDGSASDIKATVAGTSLYFDLLDSSPSVKNQLTGQCSNSNRRDLAIE